MLIHITIAFADDRVKLRVTNPRIQRVDANLVALERVASNPKRGSMVIEIGEKAAKLDHESESVIKPAYDPDAFEPELTAAVVGYYRNVLYQQVRPRLLRMAANVFFDRFRIDLLMPRFEALSLADRDRFARSLGIVWMRSDVRVNNQQLAQPG